MVFLRAKSWRVLFCVMILSLLAVSSPGAEQKKKKVVLPSMLAGKWYPADTDTLRGQIEQLFAKADVQPKDNVVALILPHAGYQYSGQTAAFGVKAAGRKYRRIVVIGPSHYVNMPETLSVPDAAAYMSPLGEVPIDVEFIKKLRKNKIFKSIPLAHRQEHSVQIQLPLLQYGLKDFELVPIVAGVCSPETIAKAARVLKDLVDDRTLVVASSDFTHFGLRYGYAPFDENIPEQIKKLDMGAYENIARLDGRGFLEYKQKTGATICGYVPIAVLLSMLAKDTKAELVNYSTSGKLTGDFTNSVSYLSVAFYRSGREKAPARPMEPHIELSDVEKKQLLMLARRSLIYFLEKKQIPTAAELNFELTDAMKKIGAAFVTLKRDNQLRGCIGHTLPQGPLYESVIQNAINAGINDWRFTAVTRDEMDLIDFEISALSEPVKVASPNDIRIGTDGVIFKKAGKSSVFLPQVAREQRWDLPLMLKNLSLKAGLSADDWKEGGEFFIFQALVFSEEKK